MTLDRDIFRMRTSELAAYVRWLGWVRVGLALLALVTTLGMGVATAKLGLSTTSSILLIAITGLVYAIPQAILSRDLRNAWKELAAR